LAAKSAAVAGGRGLAAGGRGSVRPGRTRAAALNHSVIGRLAASDDDDDVPVSSRRQSRSSSKPTNQRPLTTTNRQQPDSACKRSVTAGLPLSDKLLSLFPPPTTLCVTLHLFHYLLVRLFVC